MKLPRRSCRRSWALSAWLRRGWASSKGSPTDCPAWRGDYTQHPAHSLVVKFKLRAPGALLLLSDALLRLSLSAVLTPGPEKQRRRARGVFRCRFGDILESAFRSHSPAID